MALRMVAWGERVVIRRSCATRARISALVSSVGEACTTCWVKEASLVMSVFSPVGGETRRLQKFWAKYSLALLGVIFSKFVVGMVFLLVFAGTPFQSAFGLQSAGQSVENVIRAADRSSDVAGRRKRTFETCWQSKTRGDGLARA
jgi:hypothetical protein